MTLTKGAPSMISCAPLEGDDMSAASDRAARDGARIFATCDPMPRFIAQVREDGEWVEVAWARDLETLRDTVVLFVGDEHDALMPLLNAAEVVYDAPTPEQIRAWVDARFTVHSRAAATLGMNRRTLSYMLNGRPMTWSTWCVMAAVDAARRQDEALAALKGGG